MKGHSKEGEMNDIVLLFCRHDTHKTILFEFQVTWACKSYFLLVSVAKQINYTTELSLPLRKIKTMLSVIQVLAGVE